jgi:hypothetical protein
MLSYPYAAAMQVATMYVACRPRLVRVDFAEPTGYAIRSCTPLTGRRVDGLPLLHGGFAAASARADQEPPSLVPAASMPDSYRARE